MADLSDVETSLVSVILAVLFPTGTDSGSITGLPLRVYRGWPQVGALNLDLAAGIANVSVFSVPGDTQNTTRWNTIVQTAPNPPTLTVHVTGATATFGGVGGVGQLAGVLVANQPFVYRGKAGDTPALVAAVLAEKVRAVRACWLSASSVSVPGLTSIIGRVVSDATTLTEWGRQRQAFRISAWCPSPFVRDTICSQIGGALAETAFLELADGTAGRLRYRSTTTFDDGQDAHLYRRDLIYDVDYGTTVEQSMPSMLFGDLNIAGTSLYG